MSDTNKKSDQYIFDAELYEKDSDGNKVKTLNSSNVNAGDGVVLDKAEDGNVTISSDLGISIVNGQLCVSYEKEVDV